jgi:hypothetical protein
LLEDSAFVWLGFIAADRRCQRLKWGRGERKKRDLEAERSGADFNMKGRA